MSSAPARRCAPSGALTDREWLWAVMRELGAFTIRDLCRSVNMGRGDLISDSLAKDYLTCLVNAGIVTKGPDAKTRRVRYELARDLGVRAPRVRKDGIILPESGRTRMWKAAQVLGQFSIRELMHAASLEDAPIAFGETKSYCQWLARGGYLRPDGTERYSFVRARYTGPKAPQVLRVKVLYDPNTNADVYVTHPEGRDDL